MKKLSFLLILSTVFAQIGAKELIKLEYSLVNLPCDQQHMILKKKSTFRHTAWCYGYEPNLIWVTDGDQSKPLYTTTLHPHYTYSTDVDVESVTIQDGLTIGVTYEEFSIIKEAQRKGAQANHQHLSASLEKLKSDLLSDDIGFNILKTVTSLCTGVAAGSVAIIGADALCGDNSRNNWIATTGAGIAITSASLAASTLTWLGIRKLQNKFRTITAPAVLEYLVYDCKCSDSDTRHALTKIREIMKLAAAKKRTVEILKPLEAAIAAMPTA